MEQLLQTFQTTFVDNTGERYDVQAYATSRPGDTWQGWIVFTRQRDGKRFTTGAETTQPSAEAVAYWATGLEPAYLEGAFQRARPQDA